MNNWLLYGAYGFTGRLLLEEALACGHRPVLAGRNAEKLQPLAAAHDLEWRAFELDNTAHLREAVAPFDLVFHAAGPFIHTSEPMIQACLAGQTNYLDITGEISVFEKTLSYDAHAREQGVVLVSGVGFDIVPTDCLAKYVADRLPDATHLETAVATTARASAGTTKTGLEMLASLPQGGVVRRDGRLVSQPLGQGRKTVRFSDRRAREVIPVPWGDLVAADVTTGIPNVTCYLAAPTLPGTSHLMPLATRVLAFPPVRAVAKAVVDRVVQGPDEELRRTGRSYIWARVQDDAGTIVEAWLETIEAYQFTAVAGVRAVETVLAKRPAGALTPALALGADFVLDIEGTWRYDELPALETA